MIFIFDTGSIMIWGLTNKALLSLFIWLVNHSSYALSSNIKTIKVFYTIHFSSEQEFIILRTLTLDLKRCEEPWLIISTVAALWVSKIVGALLWAFLGLIRKANQLISEWWSFWVVYPWQAWKLQSWYYLLLVSCRILAKCIRGYEIMRNYAQIKFWKALGKFGYDLKSCKKSLEVTSDL